uniref:Uncharacterized protein n=1 Tax=Vitis vinifera TaxID=29760 RepID=F6HPS5_VITVI
MFALRPKSKARLGFVALPYKPFYSSGPFHHPTAVRKVKVEV